MSFEVFFDEEVVFISYLFSCFIVLFFRSEYFMEKVLGYLFSYSVIWYIYRSVCLVLILFKVRIKIRFVVIFNYFLEFVFLRFIIVFGIWKDLNILSF